MFINFFSKKWARLKEWGIYSKDYGIRVTYKKRNVLQSWKHEEITFRRLSIEGVSNYEYAFYCMIDMHYYMQGR